VIRTVGEGRGLKVTMAVCWSNVTAPTQLAQQRRNNSTCDPPFLSVRRPVLMKSVILDASGSSPVVDWVSR
jgi:hypothetical protein